MNIMLLIKIIGLVIILIWYLQHKYKPFLYFLIVYLLLFASDIWKLIQNIYPIPASSALLVDKIIIILGVPIMIAMVYIIWKMFSSKQK